MRVLFYEPDHSGHHFAYLGRMLPGFLRLPIEINLATTHQALDSPEFESTLAKFRHGMQIDCCCTPSKGRPEKRGWHRFQELSRIVGQLQPDHVCVMYGDGIWQYWGGCARVGRRPFSRHITSEMWMYRGRLAYPEFKSVAQRIKQFLFRGFLRSGQLDVIHPVDELLYEYAIRVAAGRTDVQLAPDPIEYRDMVDKQEARQRLSLPQSGRIVSCSGLIDRRKGCDLALQAFARHLHQGGTAVKEDRLLLAGPQEKFIRQMLLAPEFQTLVERGQIVARDEFLDETSMFLVAAASDVVLASYPNHSGRSSIILWAAAAGRPVLAVNRGCIQQVVRAENLGETCDVSNIDEFAQAIAKSLSLPWTFDDVQRVRSYARWHCIENYQELASKFVRSRLDKEGSGFRVQGSGAAL